MRLSKKITSVALASVIAAASLGEPAAQAASAKIPVSTYFMSTSEWLSEGNVKKTVTFKTGKKVNVTLTIKKGKKVCKGVNVFCVDTKGILKKFKKVKYSNIVVKADGKKVSGVKTQQGYFEKKEGTNSWRLSFYNKWGSQGDTTKSNGTSKKYAFKKNLTVSMTIVAK